MYKKALYVLLFAILIIHSVDARKPKRGKRPKNEEDTTPEPSVVSYSTFGFNDVSSYDGFVPSSPDYTSYLTSNQETTTRLYAPAFPSAMDSTGFNNNYPSFPLEGFNTNEDGGPQSSMVQYPQNTMNFFNTPAFDGNMGQNKNAESNESNNPNAEEGTGPVYGTKINSSYKKNRNPFNSTEFNVYSSGPSYNTADLSSRFVLPGGHSQPSQDSKITYGEFGTEDKNIASFVQNYPSSDGEEFVRPAPSQFHNALKFPRVVDFTKVRQYYPTELDNKYQVATYSSIINNQKENNFPNNNDDTGKDTDKPNSYSYKDYAPNFINSLSTKTNVKSVNFNDDYKDNYKSKWASGINNYNSNNNTDSKTLRSPTKGYQYSTDYSNTTFKYDYTPIEDNKKPLQSNDDEIATASSNVVDFTDFNFPDNDYTNFKKIPEIKVPFDDEYESQFNRDKFKSEEFLNQFKNLYTTTPITTSQWGNAFKSSSKNSEEFSSKHRIKRPLFEEAINNEIVHIPKRPQNSFKFNYGQHHDSKPYNSKPYDSKAYDSKPYDSKPYDNKAYENKPYEYFKQRPYKSKYEKPKEWSSKEIHNTRFKSEEDLLDLRNHDTSHPSYIPSNRPSSNEFPDETNYKKLIEKWRQSYLKSKYRDAHREYESYASEAKPIHVPIPKPYAIEIPHPVIVPVPQPYPVQVPVPKPVAVPVIRELTIPIEKPVPYPVIKKVPYPVEKHVPVMVEKEVQVPVVKPYPVHIPHVRPVFHHSRPPKEDFDSEVDAEENDYLPRPESNRVPPYKKRPRSTRNRPRRPTRMTYPSRSTSRRRWPTNRRPADTRNHRPSSMEQHSAPYRHHDFDTDRDYDSEQSEYYYCKMTGKC